MSPGIDDLPKEVLWNIFEQLPLHTIRCVLPLVCTYWRDVVCETSFWLRVNVTLSSTSDSCMRHWPSQLRFLESSPYIRNLTVDRYFTADQVTDILRTVSYYCKNIRKLLIKKELTSQQLFHIADDIRELGLKSIPVQVQSSQFCRFTALTRLVLEHGCDHEVSEIASRLPQSCALTIGTLELCDLESFASLSSSYLIQSIDCTEIDGDFCKEMVDIADFKSVNVIDKEPTLGKLIQIAKLPISRMVLQERFYAPVLPCSALITFFNCGKFDSLREIRFLQSRLDDAGTCAMRVNCPALETLELELCEDAVITEFGLRQILHLPALKAFDIRCKLPDLCYRRHSWDEHICDPMQPCPKDLPALLGNWSEVEVDVM